LGLWEREGEYPADRGKEKLRPCFEGPKYYNRTKPANRKKKKKKLKHKGAKTRLAIAYNAAFMFWM